MCDDHLTCPVCGAALAAETSVAGDNATGLYLEFFLVRFASTAVGGMGAGQAFVMRDTAAAQELRAQATVDAVSSVSAPALVYSDERGFDDDEAPVPERS